MHSSVRSLIIGIAALLPSISADSEVPPPATFRALSANLIDVSPRDSLLIVDGYPGAVAPNARILCRYDNGTVEVVGDARMDGSFEIALTADRGMPEFGLSAIDDRGDTSAFTSFPLWPPHMAAQGRPPGADGWICVTSADVDVDAELELWLEKTHKLRSWLKRIGKSFDEVRDEGISLPDSLSKLTVPTDPTDTMTGLTEPVDFKLAYFGANLPVVSVENYH